MFEFFEDSDQLVKLPETRLGAPGVLYVNQREFAATGSVKILVKCFEV